MKDVFFSLWFFLPAGIANVTPVIAAHVPFLKNLNFPLDGYKKINGVRIFGDHKTIRGFISGILFGTLTSFILFHFANNFHQLLPAWYEKINPILLGFLLSSGALLGDAVKSFFKRRMNIQPGKTWIPFDQIDYIVGGLLFSGLLHILTLYEYMLIIILWIGLHFLFSYIGYLLHLKNQPL